MAINISDISLAVEGYVVNSLRESFPNLDTTENSAIVDILAGPMKKIMEPLIKEINRIEFMSNLDNYNEISEEDLDSLIEGNYIIKRKSGDIASGEVILYLSTISDNENFVVPEGISFSTTGGLLFYTRTAHSFTPTQMYTFFNSTTLSYDIPVFVEAATVGEIYNIGEGEISSISNVFSAKIKKVSNLSKFSGGTNKESNEEYAKRAKSFYSSRNLGTKKGYLEFIKENFAEVKDAIIVGYGDEGMTRDLGKGGKVDIYIKGTSVSQRSSSAVALTNRIRSTVIESLISLGTISIQNSKNVGVELEYSTVTDTDNHLIFIIPKKNSLLSDQWEDKDTLNIAYTHTTSQTFSGSFTVMDSFFEVENPLASIISITNSRTPSIETNTHLVTGKVNTEISFQTLYTSMGINSMSEHSVYIPAENSLECNGDQLTLTYAVDDTLLGTKNLFYDDLNRIITTDVVMARAKTAYIYVELDVMLTDGISTDEAKKSSIRSVVSDYIDSITLGGTVKASEIVRAIHDADTTKEIISYVKLPLNTFYQDTALNAPNPIVIGTKNASSIISLSQTQYPVLQECVVNFIYL